MFVLIKIENFVFVFEGGGIDRKGLSFIDPKDLLAFLLRFLARVQKNSSADEVLNLETATKC